MRLVHILRMYPAIVFCFDETLISSIIIKTVSLSFEMLGRILKEVILVRYVWVDGKRS